MKKLLCVCMLLLACDDPKEKKNVLVDDAGQDGDIGRDAADDVFADAGEDFPFEDGGFEDDAGLEIDEVIDLPTSCTTVQVDSSFPDDMIAASFCLGAEIEGLYCEFSASFEETPCWVPGDDSMNLPYYVVVYEEDLDGFVGKVYLGGPDGYEDEPSATVVLAKPGEFDYYEAGTNDFLGDCKVEGNLLTLCVY